MNHSLLHDARRRLDLDFQFKKEQDGWLRQGICPSCKHRSVYTRADAPWVMRCQKLNTCGADWHLKDLYPDLFEKWSERHPTTPENPNAAADAYLRDARGFALDKIAGWYTQESYYDPALKIGSATVRFALPGGYWERLIDEPHRFGDKKAHFKKGVSYQGTLWMPPNLPVTTCGDLWIVEGIFDAIALWLNGLAAGSAMTCYNYPEHTLRAIAEQCAANSRPRPRLVWALDGDKAGRSQTLKHVEKARAAGWECTAAQIPQQRKGKLDWNDMHQRERLTDKDLATYQHHGALLIAGSATEKALLLYARNGGNTFPFEFRSRLYWFKLDLAKYDEKAHQLEQDDDLSKEEIREEAVKGAHVVTEIATCYPQALYYQRHDVTDESWYYFRVSFPTDTPAVKNTFTAAQIASAGDFKKRLLGMAQGAIFTGTTGMLDSLLKQQLQGIPKVDTIDFIGYSKEHGAYILGDVAVAKGRLIEVNDEDYFEIGKLALKSLNTSSLTLNAKADGFTTNWIGHLWTAYGARGIVALAFWFGTLFAEQIRAEHKSYPFLEVVGEPGAGKTTMLEFFWKLCGRHDYEGFDPSRATSAGLARSFAQFANLPVVLIESERESDAKRGMFDFDELKALYNGRGLRTRGMKTSGNETYDPPFRGAVVISQNAAVNASEAIQSRICHITLTCAGHTPRTLESAKYLERVDVEAVSGFILRACLAELEVLAKFADLAPKCEALLGSMDGIRSGRIAKNHGHLMALVACLADVVPISDLMLSEANDLIVSMARERQLAVTADHPHVAQFWEIYDLIEDGLPPDDDGSTPTVLNHHNDPTLIAINLPHFEEVCNTRRITCPPLLELKRLLKTSRRHKFVDSGVVVSSRIHARKNRMRSAEQPAMPMSVRCWVFEA